VSADVEHSPTVCAACGAGLGPDLERRRVSAHNSLELVRGDMSLQVTATKHVYFAVRCRCGHETLACPGVGLSSQIEGRRRNLHMNERCLVGPMLAAFIAALSLRFRLSRRKIQEFLGDWFVLELGAATIERCIHEFGLASEPVVEQLVEDVQASKIVHLDETPWYQRGVLRRMWVAVTATTTVYHIGSRRKEELTALIGEAFLGWLVTDGYVAYRFGTRTDEGSRFYAAGLSVIDTCRKRGVDPWAYACSLIAAARAKRPLPDIPVQAAA